MHEQDVVAGTRNALNTLLETATLSTVVLHCTKSLCGMQYFDMLKDIGVSNRNSTVFLPHSPANVADVAGQIRAGFMQVTFPLTSVLRVFELKKDAVLLNSNTQGLLGSKPTCRIAPHGISGRSAHQ